MNNLNPLYMLEEGAVERYLTKVVTNPKNGKAIGLANEIIPLLSKETRVGRAGRSSIAKALRAARKDAANYTSYTTIIKKMETLSRLHSQTTDPVLKKKLAADIQKLAPEFKAIKKFGYLPPNGSGGYNAISNEDNISDALSSFVKKHKTKVLDPVYRDVEVPQTKGFGAAVRRIVGAKPKTTTDRVLVKPRRTVKKTFSVDANPHDIRI